MRRAAVLFCALAAWPVAASPPVDPQIRKGTGFILGRALDIGTGQPIAGALVALTGYGDVPTGPSAAASVPGPAVSGGVMVPGPRPSTAPAQRTVITNTSGDFFFRELSGGRYSIAVAAMGYLNGGYLQRKPYGPMQFLDLAENEKRGDAVVRLWKHAAIGGRVVDEAGEPAVGASVRILQRTITAGQVRLLSVGTPVLTDDRGIYRAASLLPGDYVVGIITTQSTIPAALAGAYADAVAQSPDPSRAPPMMGDLRNNGVMSPSGTGARIGDLILQMSGTTAQGYTPPPPSGDGRMLSYTTTFFPNAATSPEATVITLGSGEERPDIDLTLRLVPTVRVSGVVRGPDGPLKNMGVLLLPPGSDQSVNGIIQTATAATDATGAFTLLGVPAGSYTLKASRSMMVRTAAPTPSDRMLWAAQPVVTESRDITGLIVELKPALTVSGRVEFVGAKQPDAQQVQRVNIMLISAQTGQSQRSSAAIVAADGTFTTNGDLPGPYFVDALAPLGWTLRSVQQAGRNVTDDSLDLSTDVSGLVATFVDTSSNPLSKVSGTVVDAKGAPETQADVIAFPADSDGWRRGEMSHRRVRFTSAKAGAFEMAMVPPGAYYVVAVDNTLTGQWSDPAFLEKLTRVATRVTIAENDVKTIALKTVAIK